MMERTHEDEQSLLAAVMVAPETLPEVSLTVCSHDFASKPHRDLWAVLEAMHEAGEHISDHRRLVNHIRDAGVLERLGGAAAFGKHYVDGGVAANVAFYAKEVKCHAVRRDLKDLLDTASTQLTQEEDPVATAEEIRTLIDRTLARTAGKEASVTLKEAAERQIELMRNPTAQDQGKLIKSGFDCIDETYGGFGSGRLIVTAARPGNGKSAFMKQIAGEMEKRGRKTLVVTLEMSPEEVATRILSERSEVDGSLFEVGDDGAYELTEDQWQRIEAAHEGMHEDVLYLHAPTGRQATIERIAGYTRLMRAKHGIEVMMLDYVGIIDQSHPRQSDYEKVTAATRTLKSLARELGIVVVALSQLNRGSEKPDTVRRPRLSDLRDSGAVEQDADAVMLLHRLEEGSSDFDLMVPKWRNGQTANFPLRLEGQFTKFVDRPIEEHPNYAAEFAEYGS